jgi:hypothetical protein
MKEFRKYIKSKSKEELKLELEELFSSFETVREHYHLKIRSLELNSNTPEIFSVIDPKEITKYKKKIILALHPDENWEGGFDTEKVHGILSKLKSKSNSKYYIEIGLHAIEESTKLAKLYGGDYGGKYYIYFAELYENITQEIIKNCSENEYFEWLKMLSEEAFDGFGYKDDLEDTFNDNFK